MKQEDIKVGKHLWYERLCLTRSGNAYCSTKPVEVVITAIEEGRYDRCIVLKPLKTPLGWRRDEIIKEPESYLLKGRLYYKGYHNTKEEAVSSYNRRLRNEIDLANSEYQLRIERLEKRFIKPLKGK